MHLNADISSALQLLENIKQIVDDGDDTKLQANITNDLSSLISILENPIFRSIVNVQDSLSELNQQLSQHPSILPVDFDITTGGELVLNVPPGTDLYDPGFGDDYQRAPEFDEQRVPSAQLSPGSPQTLGFRVVGKVSEMRNMSDGDKMMGMSAKPLDLSHQQVKLLIITSR